LKTEVAPQCPYQDRCVLMRDYREGKRGVRPDGFYYLTDEYVQNTCNTKEWRSCSEQFTYWKEDQDKKFIEKRVCEKCGKRVGFDPVENVFRRHFCTKRAV
jgi:hypothetical protein